MNRPKNYPFLLSLLLLATPLIAEPTNSDLSVESQVPVKLYEVPGLGKLYLQDTDDLVQNILKKGQIWEENYQKEIFEKYVKPDSTVVDIGAFIGSHTVKLAQLAKSGQVHAFEPQKDIFELLKKNAQVNNLNNVVLHKIALGDKICSSNTVQDLGFTKTNRGATPVRGCVEFGQAAFGMYPLDYFKLTNVSFIKIDTEGSEPIVIKGALDTIKRNRPVMFIEVSNTSKQQGHSYFTHHEGMTVDEFLKMMSDLNYTQQHINNADYLFIPNEYNAAKDAIK